MRIVYTDVENIDAIVNERKSMFKSWDSRAV